MTGLMNLELQWPIPVLISWTRCRHEEGHLQISLAGTHTTETLGDARTYDAARLCKRTTGDGVSTGHTAYLMMVRRNPCRAPSTRVLRSEEEGALVDTHQASSRSKCGGRSALPTDSGVHGPPGGEDQELGGIDS